jgi:aspartate kinase
MSLLVMKFGGTSVANVDRIKRAAKRVALEVAHGKNVIVIVSAMSGKTNELADWVNDTSQFAGNGYSSQKLARLASPGSNYFGSFISEDRKYFASNN